MLVLSDLKNVAETRYTSYWISSPQSNTWRQEAKSILEPVLQTSLLLLTDVNPLTPVDKQMISVLFDDLFLKWIYIVFSSSDSHVVSLREEKSDIELIQACAELSSILVLVHSISHEDIPRTICGLSELTSNKMSDVLREECRIPTNRTKNMFTLLELTITDDK